MLPVFIMWQTNGNNVVDNEFEVENNMSNKLCAALGRGKW